MSDGQLLDSVTGLADMSDADMIRLAQLLIDQADTTLARQREIAKLLEVPMLSVLEVMS